MEQHSLKLKILDSFYDMVTTKKSNLPIYHGNDSKEFVPADTAENKKVCNPLVADINLPSTHDFIRSLSEDKKVGLAGIAVLKDGKLVAEHYVPPYSAKYRHVSFSMCKSVTSMAVGLAMEEGLLSLDEKLVDIFPEYTGLFTKKAMKEVTVKHLLTMTAGVKFDEVSSYFAEDWRKAFIGSDVSFAPGTDFTYNSLNTYMLAAIVTRRAGCSMLAYLKSRLFRPLGIHNITWDCCPKGIERGGWGMKLSLQDMVKLGELYLNNGAIIRDGKRIQLISRAWIRESTQAHVEFEDTTLTKGYGYQIWCLKDGAWLFNGVFGQNVYINQRRNLVIACTAGGYEVFPEGHLVARICDFAADDENFIRRPFAAIGDTVQNYIAEKRDQRNAKQFDPAYAAYMEREIKPYTDRTYDVADYASSILPNADQMFYSLYMTGIEQLGISYKKEYLVLHVRDGKKVYHIRVGYRLAQPYIYQILDIGGKKLPVAAGCELIDRTEKGFGLKIRIIYLEEVANKVIDLRFEDDKVKIRAVGTPNLVKFMEKLFGEVMMQRTKKLGRWKDSAFLKQKMKKVLFPESEGIAR